MHNNMGQIKNPNTSWFKKYFSSHQLFFTIWYPVVFARSYTPYKINYSDISEIILSIRNQSITLGQQSV